eukprot:s622_g8.t1
MVNVSAKLVGDNIPNVGGWSSRSDGAARRVVLGEEADELWHSYRHMAMYEVNEMVVQEWLQAATCTVAVVVQRLKRLAPVTVRPLFAEGIALQQRSRSKTSDYFEIHYTV